MRGDVKRLGRLEVHHDLHANYTSTLYDSEKETVMYAFMSLRELQMSQLQGPTKKDFRRAYFLQEYLLSFFSLRKCSLRARQHHLHVQRQALCRVSRAQAHTQMLTNATAAHVDWYWSIDERRSSSELVPPSSAESPNGTSPR